MWYWGEIFGQDPGCVLGRYVPFLYMFHAVYHTLLTKKFYGIFGMENIWGLVCCLWLTLFMKVIVENVLNNRDYCLEIGFPFRLKAFRVKETILNTTYTLKFENTSDCSLLRYK